MAEDFGAAEPATARLFDSGRFGQMFGWAAANVGADFVLSAGVGHDGHTVSGVFGRIGWGWHVIVCVVFCVGQVRGSGRSWAVK